MQQQPVDLLFTDINMPVLSGMDFIRTLSHPPQIIFTTAYREFAHQAFDLNALDYLVKPISFTRFLAAVNKYKTTTADNTPLQSFDSKDPEYLWIKFDKKAIKVHLQEILFIESKNDHVLIQTLNATYKYYETLQNIEEQLKPWAFLRIHRSFLVNVKAVTSFSSTELVVAHHTLQIGRNYKQEVVDRLSKKSE
jgi:DNA-binding LytR/AlgR family response regulator